MNDFEKFCKLVADYWPHRKTTETQLRVFWENGTCNHKPGVVSAALSKALIESSAAPKWETIFGYLAGRMDRDRVGTSDFVILLNNVRRDMKKPWGPNGIVRKGVDNMTDEDVWLEWVRAQTHDRDLKENPDQEPCTACARTSRGDCGLGYRTCLSSRIRDREYSRWRNYIEERGEPIPAYLSM